jgi:hypothetical protein
MKPLRKAIGTDKNEAIAQRKLWIDSDATI